MHDQFLQHCLRPANFAVRLHKALNPMSKKKPPGSIEPGSQSSGPALHLRVLRGIEPLKQPPFQRLLQRLLLQFPLWL